MKVIKLSFIVLAAVLVCVGLSTTGYAFHSGGVAECDGCHTMHNSLDDAAMSTLSGLTQFHAGPYLLQGSTQSEACLNCHENPVVSSYHISTPAANMSSGLVSAGAGTAPLMRTPGGDFGWLRTDYAFLERGTPNTNYGKHRGHSINAPGFGYQPEAAGTFSPGGSYPADKLACSSCHNPHSDYRITSTGMAQRTNTVAGLPIYTSGSYGATPSGTWGAVGVYRFLGGSGYAPKSVGSSVAFTQNPPVAVAPSSYNRTEATTQTRVAYGVGMAEWCSNCHGSMLQSGFTSGMAGLVHPAGNAAYLTLDAAGIATNYNLYKKTGDLSGTSANSYLSLVPFEEGTSVLTTLAAHAKINNSALGGPNTGNETVMCLSCHRAHASGFQNMLRYAHENEFMTIADSSGTPLYDNSTTEGKVNRGLSSADQQAAYYDRAASTFAPYQRLLCNKCHAKD